MKNIKLTIEYDGSRYKGWQRLKDNGTTIQQKIEDVLSKMTGENIQIIGSGRTDMGVHSTGQIANFHTNTRMSTRQIKEYCNAYLPEDIGITKVEEVEERFHARYNAKSKTYIYKIWNKKDPRVFDRRYVYKIEDKLNIDKMVEASQLFIGEHDFKGFSAVKSKKKSTIKTINSIDITNEDGLITIVYKGNGFLHKMIRIITGTLIEVGHNERSLKEIRDVFKKGVRADAGVTAPAQGLFLDSVEY